MKDLSLCKLYVVYGGLQEPVTPVSGKRSGKVADDKPSKKFKETPSKVVNTPNRAKGKVQVG